MTLEKKKRNAWKKGVFAEHLCKYYLIFKGYRVLKHRYKTFVGEIDLIAFKQNTFIFIEIKSRPSHIAGVFSLQKKQQQRIIKAAHCFIRQNKRGRKIRFDLIVLSPWKLPKHIKNAWVDV